VQVAKPEGYAGHHQRPTRRKKKLLLKAQTGKEQRLKVYATGISRRKKENEGEAVVFTTCQVAKKKKLWT